MPSSSIEALGRLVSYQVVGHPDRARALLRTAYTLVGTQTEYFPPRNVLPARCAIQGDTVRSMAATLGRPGRTACVDIFLPYEMLHASNIPPVLSEGLSCYLVSTTTERVFVEAMKEQDMPENYCSYHKILFGLAGTGVMARPRFILNTSLAYDANQLAFCRLAEFWGVPRFTVDVLYAPSEESVTQAAEQLRTMVAFIQARGRRPLEEDILRAAVACSWAAVEGYRRYLALRAERPLLDEMTLEMLSVFATHSMLGSSEVLRYTGQLCAQVTALPEGWHGKRILQLHTLPHWQDSLCVLLSFCSDMGTVRCDTVLDADVLPESERPYESMARRLTYSSFNSDTERRTERVAELARLLRTDGAAYSCRWGYKQTSGAAQLVRRRLKATGFPTLVLDRDDCDSGNVNDSQMVTRLQAFLELLEGY